jgi:hypothetical protein
MQATKTKGKFDYGYAFRQLAEAARKNADVSTKQQTTGGHTGKTDRYGTPS